MSTLPGSQHITVPRWISFIRGVQLGLAVVILGLSAYGLYWIHFAAWGLALWSSIFTLIITLYAILSTVLPSLHSLFNFIAILVLDALAVIFWLASMADLAAQRAAFKYSTYINGCYNDGSGGICYRDLTGLEKRDVYVAGDTYLNIMTTTAVFSAFEMLLFIATLIVFALNVHKQRTRTSTGPVTNDKVEAHAMPTYASSQPHTGDPQQTQHYPEVHPQNYGVQQHNTGTTYSDTNPQSTYTSPTNATQPSPYNGTPGTTYAELPHQQPGQQQYPPQNHY